MARADRLGNSLERLADSRTNPLSIVVDDVVDTVTAVVAGRRTLMFGTNSYLGLNFNPACIEASVEAARHYGTGSTASRVAAGNHRLHVMLEEDIATLYGRRDAVIFSTGFMANLGVISALARKGDMIFVDAHCHASIFDACRLSGAQVESFAHNDRSDLDSQFARSNVPGPQTLVICEGLYSVRGDLGELKGLTTVARRHGAVVIVDEAHSLGIYGRYGRGIAEHLGVEANVDVIVGTFSKSLGGIGGYAVSDSSALRALRFMSRPYLYTASLPPPIVAAARRALHLIGAEPKLRDDLWRNARAMHDGLARIGVRPCADPGPVGSIRMPGLAAGYEFWKALLDRGIYVNLLVPPATPDGDVVLRFSVSAAHTPDQIRAAVNAVAEVSKLVKLA
ncbi:pyridoxal phosphate-dependent aminotransferase family protein [Bradyrhizobium sp. SZCCHNR1070]|uniref:aminotransferase class I/II-fold pyridoxal phosphate-dependent enzyme n=1 Tax=Bradyrhizobium sp. SZCCHNR1070 TaxID=3057361 RepID=UPI002916CAC4|nr:pyridoxal phosphate-dependent aminotransferase family protein [Bradyrhizobium sp. SZCCHNR1070]